MSNPKDSVGPASLNQTRLGVTYLDLHISQLFEAGLSEATARAYRSGRHRYLNFCNTYNFSPLPLQELILCRFVAFLSASLSYPSIRLYLCAIRHLQIASGLPDPGLLSCPRLDYVLEGIRLQQPEYTRPRRLPITPDIMAALYRVWSVPPARYLESMLWAACCLAYFGFLRCGEFTCSPNSPRWSAVVSIHDISVDSHSNPRILSLHLRHSKTDHFGKGVTIVMGQTDSFLCPVASVLSFIARRRPSPGPLFMFEDGHPLSRDVFIGAVKKALTQAGINTSQYSGHSFRIGAATAAAKAGIGDAVIQQLGRWKSSAYTRYIRPPMGTLAAASVSMAYPHSGHPPQ